MTWLQPQTLAATVRPTMSSLVGHFVGHVFLGTVGFVVLAIPPILLSIAAYSLKETTHVSETVFSVLVDVHYFLLGVDTLVFVAYILVSMYGAAIELCRYVKSL